MARSSSVDPVEKFRYRITVITIDLSITGAIESLANFIPGGTVGGLLQKELLVITRAGFSKVTSPQVTVNEINYRENIDNQRFTKNPGLSRYQPVTLSRGVTESKDLYNWYRLVNDDLALTAVANELNRSSTIAPRQSANFRKEVVIEVLDRAGNVVKRWILFNAWPSNYKSGNDLDSSSDEKLVEELTLTYEYFIEQQSSILAELGKEVAETAAAFAINNFAPPSIQQLF
jgi:phage tail-like protein